MTRTRRAVAFTLCAVLSAGAILPPLIRAQEKPATAPAANAVPAAPAARDAQTIATELGATNEQLRQVIPNPQFLGDAKFRKDNAEKALPPLKKMASLLSELSATKEDPDLAAQAADKRLTLLSLAVAFGDKDATKTLTDLTADPKADTAMSARCALSMGNWIGASADAAAQQKVLDDLAKLATANPKDDQIAGTLMAMSQLGAADDQMAKKARAVIQDHLTGDTAQQIIAQTGSIDKHVVLAGRTTTGTSFNSNTLKGKVILVDFWATWCPPCRESVPEVKKLYKTYHDKGLEIVGIDCDSADDKVNSFTKENDMPWIQLREQSQDEQQQWHPLTKKFGVDGIPTMFLIDKKGVLRYIDAREDSETKIKKLLAEPDAPAPKK